MKHIILASATIALGLATSAPTSAQSADSELANSQGAWTILQADAAPTAVLRAIDAERYLGIRCESGRTYAFLAWDSLLGPAPRLTYRINGEDAVESTWNASADGDAAFFPGRTIEFVSRLAAHDSLTAAFTPAGDSTATLFDLKGIREALAPIRETCRW
jgi:Type VI secretion system VasI, EvfG, VC_A0118